MKKLFAAAILCVVCLWLILFSGCASKPTPEEMAQVRTLKEQLIKAEKGTVFIFGDGGIAITIDDVKAGDKPTKTKTYYDIAGVGVADTDFLALRVKRVIKDNEADYIRALRLFAKGKKYE
jgi:hypothetical protein